MTTDKHSTPTGYCPGKSPSDYSYRAHTYTRIRKRPWRRLFRLQVDIVCWKCGLVLEEPLFNFSLNPILWRRGIYGFKHPPFRELKSHTLIGQTTVVKTRWWHSRTRQYATLKEERKYLDATIMANMVDKHLPPGYPR